GRSPAGPGPRPTILPRPRGRFRPPRRGRAVPFPRYRPPVSRKGRIEVSPGRVALPRAAGVPVRAAPPHDEKGRLPVGEPALLRNRRRSLGPPADHLARSRISTRRHRLVAEVGRVSMMRTRSPMPAVFSSSWALKRLVLVVTLP